MELSELATMKYEFSKVIMVRRDGKNIPMTDIRFAESIKLIEYSGYLKAGSDLSKVEVAYDEIAEQVTVRVPRTEVFDNVVKHKDMKIEDVKGNIF